jgi:mutator protein MutT
MTVGAGGFAEPGWERLASERLAGFRRVALPDSPRMRRAAVALCVVERDGRLCVIVIKRAYRGRNAGQWALPGGRLDPGETAEEAALRELEEEVGLAVPASAVLGRLDDFPAASGFAITPVVAVADSAESLRPSPAEVHAVHLVELDRLTAPDTPRWVPQPNGTPLLQMRLRDDMVIHAPTGAMLWQFREVVLLGNLEARVADFLQPDWTHR